MFFLKWLSKCGNDEGGEESTSEICKIFFKIERHKWHLENGHFITRLWCKKHSRFEITVLQISVWLSKLNLLALMLLSVVTIYHICRWELYYLSRYYFPLSLLLFSLPLSFCFLVQIFLFYSQKQFFFFLLKDMFMKKK